MKYLLVTVGTGTAGRRSNLAQGLVNMIQMRAPEECGLMPSRSSDSSSLAELVKEEVECRSPAHVEILPGFSNFDDLISCRQEVRRTLQNIRSEHPGCDLIVNPTSGTKQMTTATVLACCDEGVEQIEYITGERQDGVVKTGTERITQVNGRQILAEQSARNAIRLVQAGAYHGAALVLSPFTDLFPNLGAVCRMLYHWNRFAYDQAIQEGSGDHPVLANSRKRLQELRDAPALSLERSADMLQFARRQMLHGNVEEALAALYRDIEYLARYYLLGQMGMTAEDYTAESFIEHPRLRVSPKLAAHLRSVQAYAGDDCIRPGLTLLMRLLEHTEFAMIQYLYRVRRIWRIVQRRHDTRYGHGTRFVDPDDIQVLFDAILAGANKEWPNFKGLYESFAFPEVFPVLEQELDNLQNSGKAGGQ